MIEVARPRTHARGNYVARLHHTDGRREVLLLPAGFSPRRVTDDLLRFAGHGDFRFGQTVDSQTLRGRNRKKTSRCRFRHRASETTRKSRSCIFFGVQCTRKAPYDTKATPTATRHTSACKTTSPPPQPVTSHPPARVLSIHAAYCRSHARCPQLSSVQKGHPITDTDAPR